MQRYALFCMLFMGLLCAMDQGEPLWRRRNVRPLTIAIDVEEQRRKLAQQLEKSCALEQAIRNNVVSVKTNAYGYYAQQTILHEQLERMQKSQLSREHETRLDSFPKICCSCPLFCIISCCLCKFCCK